MSGKVEALLSCAVDRERLNSTVGVTCLSYQEELGEMQ